VNEKTCESCWNRPGAACLVDDNFETRLCKPCREALASQADVKIMRPAR
jgi:hypothetical protein